jgi:uncharacterized protein YndB with AHSA1/START domain
MTDPLAGFQSPTGVVGQAPDRASAPGLEIADTVRTARIQRHLDGEPYRVYRAWSSPEALSEWYPDRVEGSLAPGTRSTLVFRDERVWWDVIEASPDHRFQFRRPWLPDDEWTTVVSVTITPRGYGSLVTVEDGPFDLTQPGVLDAYAAALAGWAEWLANLRAVIDYSVDLRRSRGVMT